MVNVTRDDGKKEAISPDVIKNIKRDTPTEVKQPTSNILQRSLPVAGAVGGLAGSYVAGGALKGIGKATYGVTLPPVMKEAEAIQAYRAGLSDIKPRTTIQTALEQPLLQKGPITRAPSSVLGQMGTRAQIGVQSDVAAKNLRTKTVQPALERSTSTVNIQDEIASLGDDILKMAKQDPDKIAEYMKAFNKMKASYADPKYANMKLVDVQDLKSGLQARTPGKFFKGEEITNAYRELRGKLSSKLVNKLHTTLSNEVGEDTAKMYRDYNNLRSLGKIGPKALTQAGRQGGAAKGVSRFLEELATPITTTAGKLTYKAGEFMQYLPKKIVETIKKAPGTLKGMPLKTIAKSIIKEAPAGVLGEMFGKNLTKEGIDRINKGDYERALDAIRTNKKIPITSPLGRYATKGLDKQSSITLLEKLLSQSE